MARHQLRDLVSLVKLASARTSERNREFGELILCATVEAPEMGSSCCFGGALGVPPVRSAQAALVQCDN